MAFIGMRYPVASPISAIASGGAITYGDGFVVGKAISANITKNHNTNPLYADDTIAEMDNGITGMTIEFGVDDITDTVRADLLGLSVVNTTGETPTVDHYEETDASAPYVGFGYIRVRRKNGTTTYQGTWFHKVQFGEDSEAGQTKGESIEWQTPTLNGTIFGITNDTSGKIKYRDIKSFDTEAAAKNWLNTKAGISTPNL